MWTDHFENERRCEGGLGHVLDEEDVARLLHSGNSNPLRKALQKSEIFPHKNEVSNLCGESDGASVDRCSSLTTAEIRKRAVSFAGDKHTSEGALVGAVGDIRAVRVPGSEMQCVFVYDDPGAKNREHAVIRAVAVDRAEQAIIRDRILECFDRTITPY